MQPERIQLASPFYAIMRLANSTLLCSIVLLTNQAAISQQNTIEKTHQRWSKTSQEVRSTISNLKPDLAWQQDSLHYTFRKDTNKGWQWMLGNAETKSIKPAFDHTKLAAAIKEEKTEDVEMEDVQVKAEEGADTAVKKEED